jgi:hypothetical protein
VLSDTSFVTTCIYYDLEEVSADVVLRARARTPGAREFIARGTSWPADAECQRPSEVMSPREFSYQQELMDWIDRLFGALERSSAGPIFHRPGGVSLLEVLRYKFLLEFAATEQRLRALSELRRDGAEQILWVAPRRNHRELKRLTAESKSPRVELVDAHKAPDSRHPLHQFARTLVRRGLDRLADHAGRWASPRRLGRASSPRVVFAEYFPNSAKVLLPVAAALRKDYGFEVVWLATRRPVKRLLDQLGISSITLRRVAPSAHWRRDRLGPEACRQLRAALEELPDELFSGTGKFRGKGFLLPAVFERLVAGADDAIFWLDSMSEAFDHLQPHGIVSTSYSSIVGRAAACAARGCGARSAYVQHGIFPDCDFFTSFCHDLLLLWGEANRRTMLRNGISDSRIKVVGPTIYDALIQRVSASPPSPFPGPGDPIRITYLASRTGGLAVNSAIARLCLSTVVEAVARIPNGRLMVKLHPGDKTGMIEGRMRDFRDVEVVRDRDSQDVICRCDVAIVVSSTTGFEACMAGKPLIVLNVSGVPDYGPYQQYGAALQLTLDDPSAPLKLAEAIQKLSSDPAKLEALADGRRRLINDLLNGGAGNATALTAEAIAEFVESRSRRTAQLNTVD